MDDRTLQVRLRRSATGNSTVISLEGPLTMRTVPTLKQAWRETDGDVIVHFADVPAIDSSGIGALVNILISCNKNGRHLALAEVPHRPLQMLSVARVDGLFALYDTLAQAEEALARRAASA